MKRGIFSSSFLNNEAYVESSKDWIVDLQFYHTYWFDLLYNPIEGIPSRDLLIEYLSELRRNVEESLEKRFIYFISSRKRIRFDVSKKPSYGYFGNKVKIYLLVGREKERISITVDMGGMKDGDRPTIALCDGFATIDYGGGCKTTMSVYDFLEMINCNIGNKTKIEYVGYTKEPEVRPTKGKHLGLTDVLHLVSNEDNDIFITFNIFKVISHSVHSSLNLNFVVSNSMIDEIAVDLEGRILEKCFILYFNSSSQIRNKSNEKSELINNLKILASENKINSINICYEPDASNDSVMLYSSSVPASLRHIFTVKMVDDYLSITPGSAYFP